MTGADSPGCAAATPLCCFLAGADLDDSLADEFDTDALSARRTDRPNNGLPYAATLQTAATITKLAHLIELPHQLRNDWYVAHLVLIYRNTFLEEPN